jgi:5'-3' exonuclease
MSGIQRGAPPSGGTLLVDGNNILIRSVKAMEGRGADMSADGVNTGPLVLFINQVSRYVKEVQPDHMVVCWDGGRAPWRMEMFPSYKHNRGEHPTSELEQGNFGLAKEFLSLCNIHHVCLPNVEADDLIAYYWLHGHEKCTIVSGDKDFLQLVDGTTRQYQPGVDQVWTPSVIEEKLECRAEHLPAVKALTGDSSDCIPGVPGFGHKTAVKALSEHGWRLDDLLATDDPRWTKKLDGHHQQARINYSLMDLRVVGSALAGVDLEPAPAFEPTSVTGLLWSDLLDFLRRYQLAAIESRLRDERLWRN